MTVSLARLAVGLVAGSVALHAMDEQQRRAHVQWMRENLPEVPAWSEWQQKTGALPPDFDALPRSSLLPDPYVSSDGRAVRMPADWPARRAEIRRLFEQYVTGRYPAKPSITKVVQLDETRGEGYLTRNVRVEFGPGGKGSVRVRVVIPDGAGKMPVLISPNLQGWASQLVRRGYISAGYAGNDFMDDAASLKDLYPEYDFATLPRRAWLAQVVIDYLATLPQVDMERLAIFGYSRDGKMATMAAALDERISALVAGSTGVGGLLPWRLSGERGMGEGIESTTKMFPDWFAPQLRFFTGHEDRLPVDANLLLALVAPRACLIEYGLNDEVSNGWAIEQCYHSALRVYSDLKHPERLSLMRVPGFHGSNDQDACVDWLDIQFGRSKRAWEYSFLFPWSFEKWRKATGESLDTARFPMRTGFAFDKAASAADRDQVASQVRASIRWMLGDEPPNMPAGAAPAGFPGMRPPPGPTTVAKGTVGNPGQLAPDVPAWVIARTVPEFGWLEPEKNAVDSRRLRFGGGLTGDLYFPANTPAGTKLPTVIWLHGDSYPLGYMWVYRRDLHPILALAKAGYAVLAFDQCGYGSRQGEAAPFYDRFPHWSQLGRMVEDTRAAIDALQKDAQVDGERIYVFGYRTGATVGLYTAVFEPRVKGVVAVDGFHPLRAEVTQAGDSEIARLSQVRPLMPRLGLFAEDVRRIPFEYDELLATLAPRPVLIVQPQMDQGDAPVQVRALVEHARKIYATSGPAERLALIEPDDYQRLPAKTQQRIIDWMAAQFGMTNPSK